MARSSAFHSTATFLIVGTTSLINSSRLTDSSAAISVTPVTLPPGRAKLSTSPVATGSPAPTTTTGIVADPCLAASAAGKPKAMITSTRSATSRSTSCGKRSTCPVAPIVSISRLRPGAWPRSARARKSDGPKPSTGVTGAPPMSSPTRWPSGPTCAVARRGAATTAPPRLSRNSRRLMGSPRGRRLPRRSAPCLSAPSPERSWPAPPGPGGTLNPPVTPSARHLSPRDQRLRLARHHPQLAAGAPAPLRPEPVPHVLLHEHVRVQLRHPQPPVRRPLQVAQRRPDVGLDLAPEEARVPLRQVGRVAVAEPLRHPGLAELAEQRRQLARVGRVGQLADQVRRPHQPALSLRLRVVPILRPREPGQLDRPTQPLDVEPRHRGAAAAHVDLAALDVPGGQERVRGAARRGHRVPGRVDHVAAVAVALADAA